MILSMSEQSRLFFLTVAIGGGLGFLYDLFRIWRKLWRHPDFLTQLEDILYWLIVSFMMFYFLLNENYGEIRLFSILGTFIGMAFYFLLISIFVRQTLMAFIHFIYKIIKQTILFLLLPFRFIYKLLKIPLSFLNKHWINLRNSTKKSLQKSRQYVKINKSRIKKDLKIIFKKV